MATVKPSYKRPFSESLNRTVRLRNHHLRTSATRTANLFYTLPLLSDIATAMDTPRLSADIVAGLKDKIHQAVKSDLEDDPDLSLLPPESDDLDRCALILSRALSKMDQMKKRVLFNKQLASADYCSGWLSQPENAYMRSVIVDCYNQQDYYFLLNHVSLSPKTPVQPTFPPNNQDLTMTPYRSKKEIDPDIRLFIAGLISRLRAFIQTGGMILGSFVPSECDPKYRGFIENLNIPIQALRPSLLLHGLGEQSGDHDENQRLIFGEDSLEHRYVCDGPGAGKTRSTLEGLCHHWGLYFVCRLPTSDDIGSTDLSSALDIIPDSRRFLGNLPSQEDVTYKGSLETNVAIAEQRIMRVIVARLTIFHAFISLMIEEGINAEEGKRLWTLLQILPTRCVDMKDCFLQLADKHQHIHTSELRAELKSLNDKIVDLLPELDPLKGGRIFCVLDESQAAAERYINAFASEGGQPRPVLREIVRVLRTDIGYSYTLVISGTAMSELTVLNSVRSAVGKAAPFQLVYLKGNFDDPAKQLLYIQKYLPAKFLQTDSGRHLVDRMRWWLRGRYRFTAAFLAALLHNGFRNPHALLTLYIQRTTRYRPTDCMIKEVQIGDILEMHAPVPFLFDNISAQSPLILWAFNAVHQFMWYGDSEESKENDTPKELVELGLGRFIKTVAAVDEHLTILALAQWLAEKHQLRLSFYLEQSIRRRDGETPMAFERACAAHLAHVLNGITPLQDLFHFVSPPPAWASHGGHIVALLKGSDGNPQYPPLQLTRDSANIPGPQLGLKVTSLGGTAKWLSDPNGVAFLFPDKLFGPDCLALGRLEDGTFIWFALQMKMHISKKELTPSLTEKAIQSVTPTEFYLSQSSSERRDQALNYMADAVGGTDKLRILRIVVTYPSSVSIDEDPFDAPATYPLAVLDGEKLPLSELGEAITHIIAPSTAAFSMINKRPPPSDSEDSSIASSGDEYIEGQDDRRNAFASKPRTKKPRIQ